MASFVFPPISVASTLPPDAATETTLAAIDAKLAALQSTTDDIAPASVPPVASLLYGYQTSGANWDRIRVTGDNADAVGTAATGHMNAMAHGMMFNGTTWDRIRGTISTGLLVNTGVTNVVDQIDSTPLLDVSSSNIPASASAPLQVVASSAAVIRKIVSVEDIGEFIGVYTGAPASEVLLCVLPLGGGEMEVNIPAATRISLRNMKNSAITSGFISLNLLG